MNGAGATIVTGHPFILHPSSFILRRLRLVVSSVTWTLVPKFNANAAQPCPTKNWQHSRRARLRRAEPSWVGVAQVSGQTESLSYVALSRKIRAEKIFFLCSL